jgi:twinkle protein
LQTIQEDVTINELQSMLNEVSIQSSSVERSAVLSPEEVRQTTEEYYSRGGDRTISMGWPSLDKFIALSRGQLTTLTGSPSAGKSEFADAIACNLAENEDWKILFFSPENYPPSRHIRKIVEKYSRQPFLPGLNERIPENELSESIEWIIEHFKFLYPETKNRTLDFILDQIQDVDLAILDPWNEFQHDRPNHMSETEYVGLSLSKIKSTALKQNAHIFLISHPTKL